MAKLSILIPARNEIFLKNTIEDILKNIRGDTEIITVLDGYWPDPPIEDHPKVIVVHLSESVGQRAATNIACRISTAKYVMKVDAHCAFDEGFDVKMMEVMQDDYTLIPVMRNLHAFDWVCPNGHRRYQGPSGNCTECGKPTEKEIIWRAKKSPQSVAYRFDKNLHFQYWNDFGKKQSGDLTETMSIQGSCFMLTREKYLELDICSETEFNSWGQQGVEVACKTWLSGGKVLVNRKTWYAHMFRTQGGDFGFPYENPQSKVLENRKNSKELFENNKWEKAKYPFSWLINKFNPPEWENFGIEKEIIYYTCNTHKLDIESSCREQLLKSELPIVSVSLNKEIDFGNTKLVLNGTRGAEMMHRQILAGLKASKAKYIFLCESDVLYHPSHFKFTPKRQDVFYYNTNVWKIRYEDGMSVWTDDLQQVSGICANRELLIEHFERKVKQIEEKGFDGHYEPGIRQTTFPYVKGGKYGCENYKSEFPNICIRHDSNLTKSKWSPEEFRNKQFAKGWKTTNHIEGWGNTSSLLEIVKESVIC